MTYYNQQTNTLGKLIKVPDFEQSSQQIIEKLGNCQNVLIVTHNNPDGDAIGSSLAMYSYLKQKGKDPIFVLQSPIPTNLRFLIGIDNITTDLNEILTNHSGFDCIVVLDLNDISRVQKVGDYVLQSNATKIVIDHHLEPKDFADYYLIDTTASSTGEILFKLLKKDEQMQWSLDICENLYVAIMTDTGNFRFERTDGDVHRIVADLIDYGVDPVRLYNEVYNKIPFNSARLMGLGFFNLESYYNGKLALMPIRNDDFILTNTKEEDTEGFVESILSIEGVCVSMLVMEIVERKEIRVSIRSKGNYSAREIALKFGGGGHLNAAGCRFYGESLDEVKEKLVSAASFILEGQD